MPNAPAFPATQAYRYAQAYYYAPVYNPPINYGNPSNYYNAPAQSLFSPNMYGPSGSLASNSILDSILGSLIGGGYGGTGSLLGGNNVGLGSLFGGGNGGSITSMLAPIALQMLLSGGLGQNGLSSILGGALPTSYLQPTNYAPLVTNAPQQQLSGTILSAAGSGFMLLTSNNQQILVNDSSAQIAGPLNIGQWVTIYGYNSGNQFVATNVN